MSATYLPSLRERGIKVRLAGDALKLSPADRLTPKILDVCRANKAAIIAELQAELQQAPGGRSRVTADGRDSTPVSATRRIESSDVAAKDATCGKGHPVTLYGYDCSDAWAWYECSACGECRAVELFPELLGMLQAVGIDGQEKPGQ
jgi:hypothetical protein